MTKPPILTIRNPIEGYASSSLPKDRSVDTTNVKSIKHTYEDKENKCGICCWICCASSFYCLVSFCQ